MTLSYALLYTPEKDENGKYLIRNINESQHGPEYFKVEVYCEPLGGWVPFHASQNDAVAHGREIYEQIVAEHSADIVPTPQEEKDEWHAARVRYERDLRLKKTDWTQAPDVPAATRDVWTAYRQELRDVPQQEGFPYAYTWPTEPS